jgi:hypothetical protein
VRAAMPMMVSIQLASEVASRSVGEKWVPSPWLSFGASVSRVAPDCMCIACVRNCPTYITSDVAMNR